MHSYLVITQNRDGGETYRDLVEASDKGHACDMVHEVRAAQNRSNELVDAFSENELAEVECHLKLDRLPANAKDLETSVKADVRDAQTLPFVAVWDVPITADAN